MIINYKISLIIIYKINNKNKYDNSNKFIDLSKIYNFYNKLNWVKKKTLYKI